MQKSFTTQNNIGKAKYTISSHDGTKFHKDGSQFFDIDIFSNKKRFNDKLKVLIATNFIQI